MNWLADVPEIRRRRYLIFISIIIAAGIGYCAGITALMLAPSNQMIIATFTPTTTRSPTAPGATPLPTRTLPPSPTQFKTPTFTPTSTSTPTPPPTPTSTGTPTPEITDTFTRSEE